MVAMSPTHMGKAMKGDIKSTKFVEKYLTIYLSMQTDEISAEEEAEREENMAYIRKSLTALRDRIRMAGADENGLLPGESFGGKSRPPELRNWEDWKKAEEKDKDKS